MLSSGSITEDLSQGAEFRFKIASDLPEFTFKVVPEVQPPDEYGNARSTIKEIQVYRGDSGELLQRLDDDACNFEDMEPPPRNSHWFRADDFNFDGYQDLYLLTMWGATGNSNGCVWLFDPADGKFWPSKEFGELGTYGIDPKAKTISTSSVGGMAGMIHRFATYKVEHNAPVLIHLEVQDWDESRQQFHCVIEERRDGKMAVVRDVWGAEFVKDDLPRPPCE